MPSIKAIGFYNWIGNSEKIILKTIVWVKGRRSGTKV